VRGEGRGGRWWAGGFNWAGKGDGLAACCGCGLKKMKKSGKELGRGRKGKERGFDLFSFFLFQIHF
jgi:hypothetical protein